LDKTNFGTPTELASSPSFTGAIYFEKIQEINGEEIHFKICDTSSEEKYQFLMPMYYRSAKAAIVCFNLLDESSYSAAKEIVRDLKGKDVPKTVILVGTREDLEDKENGVINDEEPQAFASFYEITFMKVSCKTGLNVVRLFQNLANIIKKKRSEADSIQLQIEKFDIQDSTPTVKEQLGNETSNTIRVEPDIVRTEDFPRDNLISKQYEYINDKDDNSPRPRWVSDDLAKNCAKCSLAFTVFNRKHHCRHCGKIFCSRCSQKKIPLPKFGFAEPQRVCDWCYLKLMNPT